MTSSWIHAIPFRLNYSYFQSYYFPKYLIRIRAFWKINISVIEMYSPPPHSPYRAIIQNLYIFIGHLYEMFLVYSHLWSCIDSEEIVPTELLTERIPANYCKFSSQTTDWLLKWYCSKGEWFENCQSGEILAGPLLTAGLAWSAYLPMHAGRQTQNRIAAAFPTLDCCSLPTNNGQWVNFQTQTISFRLFKHPVKAHQGCSVTSLRSAYVTIDYLGLNSFFLANELRPQDEDFFLADFKLLTHWSQLIQEDSIRRGPGCSYLRRSRFCEGLLQLIQLILQFLILRFEFLTLQEIGSIPSPGSVGTHGTKLWIEMVKRWNQWLTQQTSHPVPADCTG